jgi:rubredoxin
LIELSKKYFEELGNSVLEINTTTIKKELKEQDIHQCPECLTLYNADFGDMTQEIEKGVLFKDLPEEYHCSLCEAPKNIFISYAEKV